MDGKPRKNRRTEQGSAPLERPKVHRAAESHQGQRTSSINYSSRTSREIRKQNNKQAAEQESRTTNKQLGKKAEQQAARKEEAQQTVEQESRTTNKQHDDRQHKRKASEFPGKDLQD